MIVCAFCGKPIGRSSDINGMQIIAMHNHQKNKHWRLINEFVM